MQTIFNTHLNDGSSICIRTVDAGDEARLRAGIARLSKRSRYMRFFTGMREPPKVVIDKLLDVDGHDHIAWGAIRSDLPEMPAIGIVHAFRDEDEPAAAEFSVAVIDDYHGLGLAHLLIAVLLLDCRQEGLSELSAQILAENNAATALTHSLGGRRQGTASSVANFNLQIDTALKNLRANTDVPGLTAIFAQYESLSS